MKTLIINLFVVMATACISTAIYADEDGGGGVAPEVTQTIDSQAALNMHQCGDTTCPEVEAAPEEL